MWLLTVVSVTGEPVGDLGIAETLGDQGEDRCLAWGQPVG
jgi:hypothetical protein